MMKLVILLFPLISFAKVSELTFSSAIEVSPRQQISAFDLVEAKNLTEEVAASLKAAVIEDRKTFLGKADLAKLLRKVKAHFVLPADLKILKSKNAVSRMEVERKIKNHIHAGCSECEIQVQVSSVPSNLGSDWQLDLNVDLSKNNVMIPISSANSTNQKGWVVAELKRYQKVPVLNRSVRMGDVITSDMLSIEKRLVTNPRETIQALSALDGMQASRFLNAGQTVQYADLKKEQVLRKGQMVKAIVGSSTFEVSISGQAEENGSIGDVIKIKNLDSQKVFAARVVDRGLVRIE